MNKVDLLARYLPPAAAPTIAKWIDYFQCEFKISKSRATKLGDYRHPFQNQGHKISVNNNLNPYAFLVTTVHEFAHLLTWNQYKGKVKPHGTEWKNNFKRMMEPFYGLAIFPPDVQKAISNYLENPAASSCSDLQLARSLKKYDAPSAHTFLLEKLPQNAEFSLPDGRKFIKGERIRKRFKCACDNGKTYLFNPLAEVLCMQNELEVNLS